MNTPDQTGVVVVIGSHSWMARHFIEEASKRNRSVHKIRGRDAGSRLTDVLSSLESVVEVLVVNFAGIASGDISEMMKINAELPAELATVSNRFGRQFVHIGTAAEYGASDHSFLSEETECAPISEYGQSKLLGSKRVLEISSSNLVLRVFNVAGNPSESSLFRELYRLAISPELEVTLQNATTQRDWMGVRQLTTVFADVLLRKMPIGVLNICTGIATSHEQLLLEIAHHHGKRKLVRCEGREVLRRAVGDPTLLSKVIGYVPTPTLLDVISE